MSSSQPSLNSRDISFIQKVLYQHSFLTTEKVKKKSNMANVVPWCKSSPLCTYVKRSGLELWGTSAILLLLITTSRWSGPQLIFTPKYGIVQSGEPEEYSCFFLFFYFSRPRTCWNSHSYARTKSDVRITWEGPSYHPRFRLSELSQCGNVSC